MSELIHIVHFSRRYAALLLVVSLCLCASCSRVQSIRDARTIVAEADSLRSAGISLSPFTSHISHFTSHLSHFTFHTSPLTSSDSTAIAEAAATLQHVHLFYPTDYAHANYYYGRLLREAGNHPEAMLAFLRVVHSRTKDHIIKGRSWSNIANMCRLAAEHGLAYDINEKSSEEFLLSDDSLMYFYALNNRAFDLAADSLKDRAIDLTNYIERICTDSNVLTKIWETRAEAYKNAKMYDSVIYCVRELQSRGNDEPTGYMLLAQAYNSLGQDDSAVYYAHKTIEKSDFYGDKYNALYILTHSDTTLTKQEILTMTSERADISMQDFTPDREKLAIAVDLLEQDLSRKPNLTWLWALLVTLCIIATSISIYIRKKKARHQLISQQVEALQQTRDSLSAQTRQIESEQRQRQEKMLTEIELFCSTITVDNINEELCWKDFDKMCTIINQRMYGLVDKLKSRGVIVESEVRLCVLVAIGKFNNLTMASLVPYGYYSFKTVKSSVSTRLGFSGRKMRDSMLKLALGE